MKSSQKITTDEIKLQLSISQVLKHYGGECVNHSSGAWWCIMHEVGGKESGHKTPSLVAKDERGTATCMSQSCFQADNIFGVIAKMEKLDLKNDFSAIMQKACELAGINSNANVPNNTKSLSSDKQIITKAKRTSPIEELGKKHLDYLKKIGISKNTADTFGLKARYDYILYPQLDMGEVKGYKGISITKDRVTNKSKQFFENYTAPLFHRAKLEERKHIVFTEGEKDCLRLSEEILKEGVDDEFIVLTITTGAKTVPNDILQRIGELKPSNISIIYDNDEAGEEGSKKLAKALVEKFEKVTIYSFSPESSNGYDMTDFLNDGKGLGDLFKLSSQTLEKERQTIHTAYPRYVINRNSILDTLTPDKILYTGYQEIDEQCPMILGENTIVVGRTGKGKTVLGVNFINGILRNNKDSKIIVFSLELKKKAFLQRLLSTEYNIETWRIKKGFVADDNTVFTTQKESYIKNAHSYIETYRNRLMIIDDVHSIDQIEKILEHLRGELSYIPDYILIDYANILTLRSLADIAKHIQISTWMKFLAKEKNIHVQAICQANRATKENDDGYARSENLADSDQYGRDAYIVYSIKTSMDNNMYSINPTKNRNGRPEEEIQLSWNPKSGRIVGNNQYTEHEM